MDLYTLVPTNTNINNTTAVWQVRSWQPSIDSKRWIFLRDGTCTPWQTADLPHFSCLDWHQTTYSYIQVRTVSFGLEHLALHTCQRTSSLAFARHTCSLLTSIGVGAHRWTTDFHAAHVSLIWKISVMFVQLQCWNTGLFPTINTAVGMPQRAGQSGLLGEAADAATVNWFRQFFPMKSQRW